MLSFNSFNDKLYSTIFYMGYITLKYGSTRVLTLHVLRYYCDHAVALFGHIQYLGYLKNNS